MAAFGKTHRTEVESPGTTNMPGGVVQPQTHPALSPGRLPELSAVCHGCIASGLNGDLAVRSINPYIYIYMNYTNIYYM